MSETGVGDDHDGMQGLLNNGDEMLIPSPDYPLWTAAVALSGGTPRTLYL